MLSNSNEFTGGDLIMGKELMTLNMGSGVMYSYVGEPHAVTPIKEGTRWIASVRLLRK
jgi:predicted 2-oxoglutarate/Fe(II)-dependent dioxygenase YbiX